MVWAIFWLCGGAVVSASFAASPPTPINIGVLAFTGEEGADRWAPVAQYLSRTIPIYKFSIVPLNLDNIDTAIFGSDVDFLLTNPASYADMEAAYGITRLLTVRNLRPGGAFTQFGAVIFTREDRSDIRELKDLDGKSFAAVHANAFGGWWMAWRELLAHGVDPKTDLARLDFTGFPQDKIVYAVKSGSVDAGTVRTDVLERMAAKGLIDLRDFRVLNPHTAPNFPLLHSTPLYPEWPLALVNQKLTGLAQEVSVALLSMPASAPEAVAARIFGWTVPLDYHTVHDLMRELRVGPYRTYGEIHVDDIFSQYWHWLLIGLLALAFSVGTTVYVWRLNLRMQRSATELEKEIMQRTQAQRSSITQAKRIRALYNVASMPGMSFDDEFAEVLRAGCALLGLELGKIMKVDTTQNRSEVIAVHAPDDIPLRTGDVLPLDKTFCIIPSLSKRPFATEHVGRSKWGNLPCYKWSGMEAYIAAPVWVGNHFFGTLSYSSRAPRAEPFQETDSDLVQLMGRWVGVTLERRAQQQELDQARRLAESASRTKSDFLARMSHELRTPLNAIIGYSEMVMDELRGRGNEQEVSDLSRIQSSGKHLLGLINDVLDLSKIEAGKMELIYDTFDVRTLVDEVAATIAPLAAKNRNEVEIFFADNIGDMTADTTKVRQALLNILSNACKFTEDGRLTLRVARPTENNVEWMEFSVADTGIGMTSAQIDRLFEDFSQVSAETSRKYGGTGLGLAISKKFCVMMGGSIEVNSQPQAGSTFVMRVPANKPGVHDAIHRVHKTAVA